ncbi:MAG: phosphoribosylglycinamide formyltransferase [Thermodesulfobacteriota bacterium]
MASAPIRIGIFISGTGSNMDAVIDACADGTINGEVVFAGADRAGAAGLEKAKSRGIATFAVDYSDIIRSYKARPDAGRLPADFDFEEICAKQSIVAADAGDRLRTFLHTRAIAEAELLEKMRPFNIDLLVLAGFMRNLTPYFIDRVNTDACRPRIMNIHPALLPAFAGTDGYGDTLRYGAKVGGCTVHFIDYGEDSGPIIGQRCFAIEPEDTLETVKQKGLKQEWELYPECIRLFAENRLETVTMTYTLPRGQIYQRKVVHIID